jgi:hypothetical protein
VSSSPRPRDPPGLKISVSTSFLFPVNEEGREFIGDEGKPGNISSFSKSRLVIRHSKRYCHHAIRLESNPIPGISHLFIMEH